MISPDEIQHRIDIIRKRHQSPMYHESSGGTMGDDIDVSKDELARAKCSLVAKDLELDAYREMLAKLVEEWTKALLEFDTFRDQEKEIRFTYYAICAEAVKGINLRSGNRDVMSVLVELADRVKAHESQKATLA